MINEGRFQGGRAPYGYVAVDAGPHPNPRKAVDGHRLRVLAIDPEAAEVVRRIFAEYLDENGDRAIAAGLNRDGTLCPSAHRPRQNTHRHADGWQGSTVRAILENPCYTGYAFFGRWTKHEVLLDPDDVVSVEMFVQAQIRRRSRAAGGMRGIAKLERQTTKVTGPYLLRGRFHCGLCERKMQGTTIRKPRTELHIIPTFPTGTLTATGCSARPVGGVRVLEVGLDSPKYHGGAL